MKNEGEKVVARIKGVKVPSETGEKCRALGSRWRAMTEVDSPRFAVGLPRPSRVV